MLASSITSYRPKMDDTFDLGFDDALPESPLDRFQEEIEGNVCPPGGYVDQLPENLDAPLLPAWRFKHLSEQATRRLESELQGPHASAWQYRQGILQEISRLAAACRRSTAQERESNLRQLRATESALTSFHATPEFQEALRYTLTQLRRIVERIDQSLLADEAKGAAKERTKAFCDDLSALLAGEIEPESHKDEISAERRYPAKPERPTERLLPTPEVAGLDWPIPPNGPRNFAALFSDVPKWLKAARISEGAPGKEAGLWDPVMIGICMALTARGKAWVISTHALDRFFKTYLPGWADEWDEKKSKWL